ncbi:MAG: ABC transporter permease [bacterium]
MTRYIIRRILYMIPIILGVILITFLLFNVVAGSPASLVLGKNASPRALEEFDEQRGFNKPVVAGWWTSTRANPEMTAREMVKLSAPTNYPISMLFPLRPDTRYRLNCKVNTTSAKVAWITGEGVTSLSESNSCVGRMSSSASSCESMEFSFRTGSGASTIPVNLVLREGSLEVKSISLERRMSHWSDSQLLHYFKLLARLDLGTSLATNEKVTTMLRRGIGPSLALTVPIFTGGVVLSIGLALVCAAWRNRWLDHVLVISAVVLMSVNYLVWIILGQFILAFKLNWFPIWGFESWTYLLLPVFIGVLSGLGGHLRFYRTVILDELYKDYVKTAYAKGLSPTAVLFRHVLPNAMIPIVTNTALSLPFLYTGSLLLESFFGIPGLGGLSVNAINSADVDVVRGVVLVGAALYVVASLLTDVCYAMVDPRVKLR